MRVTGPDERARKNRVADRLRVGGRERLLAVLADDVGHVFQLRQQRRRQVGGDDGKARDVADEALHGLVDGRERRLALGQVVHGADRLVPPVDLARTIEQVAHAVIGGQAQRGHVVAGAGEALEHAGATERGAALIGDAGRARLQSREDTLNQRARFFVLDGPPFRGRLGHAQPFGRARQPALHGSLDLGTQRVVQIDPGVRLGDARQRLVDALGERVRAAVLLLDAAAGQAVGPVVGLGADERVAHVELLHAGDILALG